MPETKSNNSCLPDLTARGVEIQIEGWHAQNCLLIEELKTPRIVTSYSYVVAAGASEALIPSEKKLIRTSAEVLAAWKPGIKRAAKRILGGSPDYIIRNFEDLERMNTSMLLGIPKVLRATGLTPEEQLLALHSIMEEYAAIGAELSKLRLYMEEKPSQLTDVTKLLEKLSTYHVAFLSSSDSLGQLFRRLLRALDDALKICCSMLSTGSPKLPDKVGVTTNAPESCDVYNHCDVNVSEEPQSSPEELYLQQAMSGLYDATASLTAWLCSNDSEAKELSLTSIEFFATTTLLLDFAIQRNHDTVITKMCELVLCCAKHELRSISANGGRKSDMVAWKREHQQLLSGERKASEWETSKTFRESLKTLSKKCSSLVMQSYVRFWSNEGFSCGLLRQMTAAEDVSMACTCGIALALALLRCNGNGVTALQVYYCCMLLQHVGTLPDSGPVLAKLGVMPEAEPGTEWQHVLDSIMKSLPKRMTEHTALSILGLAQESFSSVDDVCTTSDTIVEVMLEILEMQPPKVVSLVCDILVRLTPTSKAQGKLVAKVLIDRMHRCRKFTAQDKQNTTMYALKALEKYSDFLPLLDREDLQSFWSEGFVISMCSSYPRGYAFWLSTIPQHLARPQAASTLRAQAVILKDNLQEDCGDKIKSHKLSFFIFIAMHHDCSMTHWFVDYDCHTLLAMHSASYPRSKLILSFGQQNVIWMLTRAVQYMASRGERKQLNNFAKVCANMRHATIRDAILRVLASGGAELVAAAAGHMPPPPVLTHASFQMEEPLDINVHGVLCSQWESNIHSEAESYL